MPSAVDVGDMREVTVAWTKDKQPVACSPTMTDDKQIREYLQDVGILKRETVTDTFIPIKDLEWRTTKINRYIQEGPEENHIHRFELEMFEPYASWDALDMWEDERFVSMQNHIKQGDVLYEIGAEAGLFPAIFSKYMTDQIVLVEPTAEFWPGIKAIFERNNLEDPLACWPGFLENKNSGKIDINTVGWPKEAEQEDVIDARKYRNIWDKDDAKVISSLKLDTWIKMTGITPDHMSIDVEGAELLVLKGAEQTLKKYQPLVWCSVHPDLLTRDYDTTKEDVLFFMDECGYDAELLAIDHEMHVKFTPKNDD